jgi:hypothetical protein
MLLIRIVPFFLFPLLLSAQNNTTINITDQNSTMTKRSKIECIKICNKKRYREKEIAKAISFYKTSKYYNFDHGEF